ncbi:MAG: phosphoheptose isomerase [Candidatus Poseidoniaceae archaeon]|nr:phosphoheptose isomerase [Candidatus Poseidoniaceae archaeon]
MVDLLQVTDERGLAMSPTLPEDCKNFLIDIDGTVCEDIPNEEPERMATAEVFPDVVEVINKWHAEGHIITFFTSRLSQHAEVTEAWLDQHGFRYHGVLYNKPRGGNYHWVDNHTVRATRFNSKFTELVKRWAEVEVFDDEKSSLFQRE